MGIVKTFEGDLLELKQGIADIQQLLDEESSPG